VLLIDNYDSFTYNLAQLFGELGGEVVVHRNDEITVDEAAALDPTHVVISPGPGRPEAAGVSEEVVRAFSGRKPVLGVCLGHQAIVSVFGGEVGPARELVHGKATMVAHDGRGLFDGLLRTSSPAATTRSRRPRCRTRWRSRQRRPTAR